MSTKNTLLNVFCLNKQGSTAILLSLMVSTGVLGTIYLTQRMSGNFLSRSAQTMEEWEKHLVTQSAQTVAAYMVSNNLVMCREGGWKDKVSKCRWSTVEETDKPSAFNLSDESDSEEGLSYTGVYAVDGNDKKYKVTFKLMDYRDTSLENVIGEIPEAVCRDKDTLHIIKDADCKKYSDIEYTEEDLTITSSEFLTQACQEKGSGNDISNSFCEYSKPVDDDHWIVLVAVEVEYKDPISKLSKTHIALSGVRRPLGFIKFGEIVSGRRCAMACEVGNTANPFSNCRSDAMPAEEGVYTGKASNVVTVKNQGPGAIYSLSLMRSSVSLVDENPSHKLDVVQDIVKQADLEVFLPGEEIKFEYFYDCPITVKKITTYEEGDKDNVKVTIKNQMVPFESFTYGFRFDAKNPVGVCYSSSETDHSLERTFDDVSFVIARNDEDRVDGASCSLGETACSAEGKNGTCQFVGLEPKRVFVIPDRYSAKHKALVRTIETTITKEKKKIANIDPQDGGGDGGGCCGGPGADGVGSPGPGCPGGW